MPNFLSTVLPPLQQAAVVQLIFLPHRPCLASLCLACLSVACMVPSLGCLAYWMLADPRAAAPSLCFLRTLSCCSRSALSHGYRFVCFSFSRRGQRVALPRFLSSAYSTICSPVPLQRRPFFPLAACPFPAPLRGLLYLHIPPSCVQRRAARA